MAPEMLPASLHEIVERVGLTATLALVQIWGGRRLYVPMSANLREDHSLVMVLGRPHAEAICELYGGRQIEIPKAVSITNYHRDREIRERLKNGATIQEVSEEFGLKPRQVYNVRNDSR